MSAAPTPTPTPTKWTYGEDGLANPVKPNEVWQVGTHIFVCSDLLESNLYPSVVAGKPATLLYSDPPWNQGNINSFRTKAGLPYETHSWLALYERMVSLAKGIPLYIEGGVREVEQVAAVLPGPAKQRWTITYYGDRPCVLHYSGPGPSPVPDLEGMDDEHTPKAVMEAYGPVGVVLEPCNGLGTVSYYAAKMGWTSITNELHPRRVSAAMQRVARVLKEKPVRVR